ncbi:MAG: hypothetical protein BWY72_02182 [Bacteroidetes bacterium ADurb.Bin416]|nr:MAG: hypothetical protein BWY72_02182 [Bacteroidetes bacterium ADurb.Bin416]
MLPMLFENPTPVLLNNRALNLNAVRSNCVLGVFLSMPSMISLNRSLGTPTPMSMFRLLCKEKYISFTRMPNVKNSTSNPELTDETSFRLLMKAVLSISGCRKVRNSPLGPGMNKSLTARSEYR